MAAILSRVKEANEYQSVPDSTKIIDHHTGPDSIWIWHFQL